jgi:hypothetical protein
MNYSLTEHARDALEKRRVAQEWLQRAFAAPESVERDAIDPDLEHRLVHIPEFGGRTLRVIVNVRALPPRIVTAYFDRRRKNR